MCEGLGAARARREALERPLAGVVEVDLLATHTSQYTSLREPARPTRLGRARSPGSSVSNPARAPLDARLPLRRGRQAARLGAASRARRSLDAERPRLGARGRARVAGRPCARRRITLDAAGRRRSGAPAVDVGKTPRSSSRAEVLRRISPRGSSFARTRARPPSRALRTGLRRRPPAAGAVLDELVVVVVGERRERGGAASSRSRRDRRSLLQPTLGERRGARPRSVGRPPPRRAARRGGRRSRSPRSRRGSGPRGTGRERAAVRRAGPS